MRGGREGGGEKHGFPLRLLRVLIGVVSAGGERGNTGGALRHGDRMYTRDDTRAARAI